MTIQRAAAIALLALSTMPACGEKNTPEETCTSYMDARKKSDWPAPDGIKSECVAELKAAKKSLGEEEYLKLRLCMMGTTMEGVNGCIARDAESFKSDNDGMPWKFGVASDVSGEWASTSPKKLSSEECNEGAFAIATRKWELKIFKDQLARDDHEKELAKSCKDGKSDEKYVAMFACLRKAKSREDIMKCS